MQLAAALLGILGILLPLTLCEKKDLRKHFNKTRPSPNKRWMSSFAQNFIKSQPVQRYTTRYNQELYNQPQEQQNNHYEFTDSNIAPYEDTNFQGLKEIKVPKPQTDAHNQEDPSVMFASDMAQLLKPGIGDDPSDMPGGLKSYGNSLNGVGLPITGKLRSTKLNPVASYAEQTGEEMNPHKVLLSPATAVIPAVIADSIRSDSSTSKLLDEMPGKISEVSASEAESSKAFAGAGESSMIVSSSTESTDPSPTALTSATDNSVTAQIDTNETANNDQPSTTSTANSDQPSTISTAEKTGDKVKQETSAPVAETTEVKEAAAVTTTEKTSEAGITNDSDAPTLKAKKPKQVTGHPTKSNETSKKLPGRRRQNPDAAADDASSTKAVEVSTDKGTASITEETQNNTTNTNEDEAEDETEKTPSKVKEKLVSSLREALLENVKEMLNGENSKQLLEEAQTVTDDKPNNLTNQEEDEGSTESVTLNKEISESRFVEDDSTPSLDATKVKEQLGVDKPPGNLLESNLMKIDKKKLVHLLATLMKRYKSNGGQATDADATESKSDEKGDDKGKETSAANSDEKNNDKNLEKALEKNIEKNSDEKTAEALKEESNNDKLKDDKEKEERVPAETKKVNKQKHQNAVSRMAGLSSDFFDPYAQIGLTDPKVSGNPAVTNRKVEETPIGRHSVHINLFGDEMREKEKDPSKTEDPFKTSKEFEGKVESETQRAEEIVNENVEKQRARLEEAVQKAHSKESLENEELIKESKEMLKASGVNQAEPEDAHKEVKELENEKELSALKLMENMKIAHMKPESIIENGLIKASSPSGTDAKEADSVMENTKNIEENESSLKQGSMNLIKNTAEREKSEAMKEAQSVQAELEKEREELKMLKEQAKLEKAREEELKLANAELEEKDKKQRAAFLEKVKQQQQKDTKQQEEATENKNRLKNTKEEASEIGNFKQVNNMEAKSQKLSDEERMAGKAEFTAEKGEKELEKAEKDTSNQLSIEKVVSEQKLQANEKNTEDEKMADKVNDSSERMQGKVMLTKGDEKDKDELKITIASEEKRKNTKDESTDKTKENELKAVESMLEEKEKKVKSLNKEKDEELNRKEMELKEAQKVAELEGKKENGKQNAQEMGSKGKEDKEQSKGAENFNANDKKPTNFEHNRYIHVVSPELVNAIANKVPPNIMEAERESTKMAAGPYVGNNVQKGDNQEKVEGEEKAVVMGGKEAVEEKPRKIPVQEKEGMDERVNKGPMNEKLSADVKQDKLSRDTKRPTDEKGGAKNYEEKDKQKTEKYKEQETKERNEEFMAIDGPNIETLIEHMEERMRQKKKEKDSSKENAKYSKEGRKKSGYLDDAYAQIGSMDPNVKRRRISKKMKKHSHHHHLKNKLH